MQGPDPASTAAAGTEPPTARATATDDNAVAALRARHEARLGLAAALGAFFIWGLFPIYWKALAHIPALEVAAHRLLWSFLVVLLFLALRRGGLRSLLRLRRRQWGWLALSGGVIGANWWLYVWAVAQSRVVEASLGYFVSPLMSVALGVVVLGERLERQRWLAVALATAGVAWLTARAGGLPWIALCLATSFALYGLVRKRLDVDAATGLAAETTLWALPALLLVLLSSLPEPRTATDWALFVGAGAVTALPLGLYAFAARRMSLSNLGLLQYLGPTMQLLLGVLLYGEAFDSDRLIGFTLIWSALALLLWHGMRRRPPLPAAP